MSQLPKPDWFSKPPEEWPSSAREFYRLCWVITRRIQERRAREQAERPAAHQDGAPPAD